MIDSGNFNSFDLTGKECCKWEKIVLPLNILEKSDIFQAVKYQQNSDSKLTLAKLLCDSSNFCLTFNALPS